jgi:hypothetical protein
VILHLGKASNKHELAGLQQKHHVCPLYIRARIARQNNATDV